MTGASDPEAREFAAAFLSFLRWVHSEEVGARQCNEMAALVVDFLGDGASEHSVVTRSLPVFESLDENASEPIVTAARTSRALDDLLDSRQRLTRSLLGVRNDPESLPPGGSLGSLPPQHPRAVRIGSRHPGR
jgi:hypothetical protein